jgi:hypothetical protein
MPYISSTVYGGNNSLGVFKFQQPMEDFLGTAKTYSVLGTNFGNSGATIVNWDLGVGNTNPLTLTGNIVGTAITVGGYTELNTPKSMRAMLDAQRGYNQFRAMSPTGTGSGTVSGDLAGLTLGPGVYRSSAVMSNSGTFILDGQNDPSAIFVLQTDAAYSPAISSSTVLIRGAQSKNVYWQIGGAMSAGASAILVGNFICAGNMTLGAAAMVQGRLIAFQGAINFSANNVTTT